VGRLRAAVRTAHAGKGVAQRPALDCRRRARALVSSGMIAKTAATVRSSPFMNASLQRGHSRLGAYEWTTLRSSLSAWQTSHSRTPPSCQVMETVDGGMAAPYHPRAPRPGTESAHTVIVLETAAGTLPALTVVRSPVLRLVGDTAGPTAPMTPSPALRTTRPPSSRREPLTLMVRRMEAALAATAEAGEDLYRFRKGRRLSFADATWQTKATGPTALSDGPARGRDRVC
jgi:hypothetical protein